MEFLETLRQSRFWYVKVGIRVKGSGSHSRHLGPATSVVREIQLACAPDCRDYNVPGSRMLALKLELWSRGPLDKGAPHPLIPKAPCAT